MSSFRSNLLLLLLALAAMGFLDLLQDGAGIWTGPHGVLEALFLVLSLGAAAYLWWGWRAAYRNLVNTRLAILESQTERDAWRSRALGYLKGLGQAIAAQFREWGLTEAESETGLLLLKGFSHKEIGNLTGRSERTVRQHAISLYRKSGLGGRAQLSAFFLEDLLLPASPSEPPSQAVPEP